MIETDALQQAIHAYHDTLKHPHPDLATHLANVQARLDAVKARMKDLNAMLPEALAFLKARGLSHMDELNEKECQELNARLAHILALITEAPSSDLLS